MLVPEIVQNAQDSVVYLGIFILGLVEHIQGPIIYSFPVAKSGAKVQNVGDTFSAFKIIKT